MYSLLCRFYPIYNGPNQSHKVNKLSELMAYDFRICARNEAGDGPYSDVFTFSTPKAPPAPVKGTPHVEGLFCIGEGEFVR